MTTTFTESRPPLHHRPFVVMGGVMLLLLALLVYVFFKDDPPPNDADLLPDLAADGGLDNPLAVFCRDMGRYKIEDWEGLPTDLKELQREHGPQLQAFLDKHTAEQALYDELMRSDPTSWRWSRIDMGMSATGELLYVVPCMVFSSKVIRARILRLMWADRHDEAADEALKLMRFGSGMMASDGPLLHCLAGITAQRLGEQFIQTVLSASADVDSLQKIQEAMVPCEITSETFARMLRVDYKVGKEITPCYDEGAMAFMGINAWESVAVIHATLPNRTTTEYGAYMRPFIHGLESDWVHARHASDDISREIDALHALGWRILLRPNSGGKIMIAHCWPIVRGTVMRSCSTSALHHMTIVTIALRRYELAHSRTPASLQELVPAFLAVVPDDPFDNKPLRWDAQKKWLYSVGENGIDDGGKHSAPEKATDLDIVMPYWWLAKEEK
jgi:hypothetical protein